MDAVRGADLIQRHKAGLILVQIYLRFLAKLSLTNILLLMRMELQE